MKHGIGCRFSTDAIIKLKSSLLFLLAKSFYQEWILVLLNGFSASIEMIIDFFLKFLNMKNYMDFCELTHPWIH